MAPENTGCWTKADVLNRIRSGITCIGSIGRCNPLISLLSPARSGSRVVPICTPPSAGGIAWPQIRDSLPQYESLDVTTDRAGRSSWDLKVQQNMAQLNPVPYKLIFMFFFLSSCSSFTYSIDLDPVTHLAAPADLEDGCHKQLPQI